MGEWNRPPLPTPVQPLRHRRRPTEKKLPVRSWRRFVRLSRAIVWGVLFLGTITLWILSNDRTHYRTDWHAAITRRHIEIWYRLLLVDRGKLILLFDHQTYAYTHFYPDGTPMEPLTPADAEAAVVSAHMFLDARPGWHRISFPAPFNHLGIEREPMQLSFLGLKAGGRDMDWKILQVPLWQIALLLGSLPTFIAMKWAWKKHGAARSAARGRCVHCGYDLRAHATGEKCPECGTIIVSAPVKASPKSQIGV